LVKELRLFSRRQLMATASLAASTAAAASFGIAYASQLRSTPGQILGPFWPTQGKPDLSGDLTRVPGSTGRAMGQVLHVSGRVLNRDGMPVPNAKLDIWQGRCHGALGLRSGRWPNNRADEENQLRGIRFPPEIIHQAIWLYLRFTLSFRDVEDLLAERGLAVSYETVRRWVNHFGPMIAADLRKRRQKPHTTWHLDEVYLKIDGQMVYLWRPSMLRARFSMCWSSPSETSTPRSN
jgi:hypothetical protein